MDDGNKDGGAEGTPSPTGFGSDSAPGQSGDLGGAGTDPLTTADADTDPDELGGVGTQRGPSGSSRD